MNILYQNATERLLEKIKSLGMGPCGSWRCIHIHLSDKPERYNHGLRAHFVARGLIDRLADADGYMYLCDDGDIFLLFQGPVKPVVTKLSEHFDDIAPDLSNERSQESRFAVYDLGIEWEPLYLLCYDRAQDALTMPEGFYAAFAYSPDAVGA